VERISQAVLRWLQPSLRKPNSFARHIGHSWFLEEAGKRRSDSVLF